jgi:hypothetical protein
VFKVWDKVVFKNYNRYEYQNYRGQSATITRIIDTIKTLRSKSLHDFHYRVQWSDGTISNVNHYNVILSQCVIINFILNKCNSK